MRFIWRVWCLRGDLVVAMHREVVESDDRESERKSLGNGSGFEPFGRLWECLARSGVLIVSTKRVAKAAGCRILDRGTLEVDTTDFRLRSASAFPSFASTGLHEEFQLDRWPQLGRVFAR